MLFEPCLKDSVILASQRAGAREIPEDFTAVNIDRTTWLGNPFSHESDRRVSIKRHREWFKQLNPDHRIKKELRRLIRRIKKGEKIALTCWCSPKPCHGKVYVEYITDRL